MPDTADDRVDLAPSPFWNEDDWRGLAQALFVALAAARGVSERVEAQHWSLPPHPPLNRRRPT